MISPTRNALMNVILSNLDDVEVGVVCLAYPAPVLLRVAQGSEQCNRCALWVYTVTLGHLCLCDPPQGSLLPHTVLAVLGLA